MLVKGAPGVEYTAEFIMKYTYGVAVPCEVWLPCYMILLSVDNKIM